VAPLVETQIQAGRIPGAVVLVGAHGRAVYRAVFGSRSLEPAREPLAADDIFDLASLTKVVATTTAVMQLVEAGRLDLDKPAALYWPAFAAGGKGEITVRELLTHTSGLPPDLALSPDWRGEDAALARASAEHTIRPPGAAFLYSDINFIVLGELVRRVSGEPLDAYVQRHIFQPLGMADTGFTPSAAQLARIVPTDREDGQLRRGQVQDPTAYRMGGVAGHAGLFSTADDLARFARMLLQGGSLDGARILAPETVALMTRPVALPGGVRRGLGWDSASPYSAGMDVAFGPSAYGHTGYTGCSLWIDPSSGGFLILLTSRLHPDGHGDVKPLRHELARLVAEVVRPAPVAEPALASAATQALAQVR
jgi:CubicO group peptidase (beta-lactamase class C family)